MTINIINDSVSCLIAEGKAVELLQDSQENNTSVDLAPDTITADLPL